MIAHVPNFFIVGAARSGTTSLARYLEEHPQVYMSPIKEPSYFANDIIAGLKLPNWSRNQRGLEEYLNGPMQDRRGGCVLHWESYLKLFRNVTNEIAIGEASTAYLISPSAPTAIHAAMPNARIIVILRNPVERVFSTYLMLCRNGRLRENFSDVLRRTDSIRLNEWRHLIIETRKIASGFERFLRIFPPNQLRWYFHEDFSREPAKIVRDAYAFLGVNAEFQPNLSRRYNEHMIPKAPLLHHLGNRAGLLNIANRWIPRRVRPLARRMFFKAEVKMAQISAEDRALLIDHFREDVQTLSKLVKKDLSNWLKVEY